MKRSLALLAAGLLLATGCRSDAEEPAEPTTTSAPPVVTTLPAPTSTLPAPTSTLPVPPSIPPDAPALLLAHDDGVDLWTPTGTTSVWSGEPVRVALPDGRGGVVFQAGTDTFEAVPIRWIPALGAEPVVLVDGDDARFLTAVQLVEVEGRPTLVYHKWTRLPNDCPPADEECLWDYDVEHLMLRDLDSGEERNLGRVGSFESDGIWVHLGGDRVAITVQGYGDEDSCAGILELGAWLDAASEERWIGSGGTCVLGPTPECPQEEGCSGNTEVALASDGSRLAYAYSSWWAGPPDWERIAEAPVLVVRDIRADEEVLRVEIGEVGVQPTWIDFDGSYAVVGRADWSRPGGGPLPPVLVDPDGQVTPLDIAGRAAIWPAAVAVSYPSPGAHVDHRECRFEGTAAAGVTLVAAGRYPVEVADDGSWAIVLRLNPGGNMAVFAATNAQGHTTELRVPVYYDPPLELRPDGLGPVDFGAPMDAAVEALTGLLGPPARDEVHETPPQPDVEIFEVVGYPARVYARFMSWERPDLQVMFSDADGFRDDGEPHLNGWVYHGPGEYGPELVTAAGIGVGATVPELEEAYGDDVTLQPEQDEITGRWHWQVRTSLPSPWEGEPLRLWGVFDRAPSAAGAQVTEISAGYGFDTC